MEALKRLGPGIAMGVCASAFLLGGCWQPDFFGGGGDWSFSFDHDEPCPPSPLADGVVQAIDTLAWPPRSATDFPHVSCDSSREQCAVRALYGGGGEMAAGNHCLTNVLGETLCFGWPGGLGAHAAVSPPNIARLDVVDVDVGASFRCFRGRDRVLRCEGFSDWFGVTDPDGRAQWVEEWVEAEGVDAAGVGGTMLCYVRDGQTFCRGYAGGFPYPGDPSGELTVLAAPTEVLGLPPTHDVVVGIFSACALSISGEVHCWGSNDGGQLGRPNDAGSATPVPIAVPALRQLSAGAGVYAGIDFEGGVWLWGTLSRERPDEIHAFGGWQLYCCPSREASVRDGCYVPAQVTGLPGRAIDVGVGREHACALLEDGRVFCWGGNRAGQLGQGDVVARPQPTYVPLDLFVQHLSVTRLGTCVSGGDELWCWGDDEDDNLHVGPADYSCEGGEAQADWLINDHGFYPCVLEPRRVLDYPPAP